MTPATRTIPAVGRQIIAGALFLLVVAAIAFFGSFATAPNTDGWYANVERAPWSPPDWLFGPAWTTLYILIALAGFLVWRAGFRGAGTVNAARGALSLYVGQLVLNALWTPIFFAGYPLIGDAAWWIAIVDIVLLILAVVWLISVAWKWSKTAAVMLIPYLGWLIFASTLNAAIIVLN